MTSASEDKKSRGNPLNFQHALSDIGHTRFLALSNLWKLLETDACAMPLYRIYKFLDGHVLSPPGVVNLSDDDEAIQEAKKARFSGSIEVWDGARLVAHFTVTDTDRLVSKH